MEAVDAGRAALGPRAPAIDVRGAPGTSTRCSSTPMAARVTARPRRAAGRRCERMRGWSSPRTASRSRWPSARRTSPSSRRRSQADRRAPRPRRLGGRLPEPQRQRRAIRGSSPTSNADPGAPGGRRCAGAWSSAPIGFVCDHVEVLYDLDVEARATAGRLRARLRARRHGERPPALRAHAGRRGPGVPRRDRRVSWWWAAGSPASPRRIGSSSTPRPGRRST